MRRTVENLEHSVSSLKTGKIKSRSKIFKLECPISVIQTEETEVSEGAKTFLQTEERQSGEGESRREGLCIQEEVKVCKHGGRLKSILLKHREY